jgi:hypothetical protein
MGGRRLGTKGALLIQFDILYQAMRAWGIDNVIATGAKKWATETSLAYLRMSTSFNHIFLDCPDPSKCSDPLERGKNIRKCHDAIDRVGKKIAQVDDLALDAMTRSLEDLEGLVRAGRDDPRLQDAARKGGYGIEHIIRRVADQFSLVLDEYTSRFPLDFVAMLTEQGKDLNEVSARQFGDTLYVRMIELNPVLEKDVNKSQAMGEMPALLHYMRKGIMVVPSPQEICDIAEYVQRVSAGRGSQKTYAFLETVQSLSTGKELVERLTRNVAQDVRGWSSADNLIDLGEPEFVARRLAMAGQYSSALQTLQHVGVEQHTLLEIMELFGTWNDEPAQRLSSAILANKHRASVLHALVENRDMLFSGDGVAAEILLSAKQAPAKIKHYVSLRDSPAKQEAYMLFVKEKPKAKPAALLSTLEKFSDLRVRQALDNNTSLSDLEPALEALESMQGPVFYDHPLYAEVTRHNAWETIRQSGDPVGALDYLSSLPSSRVRGCLLRNRSLLKGMLEDLGHGGVVASQLQESHGLKRGIYQHILGLFPQSEEKIVPAYDVDKVIFVGDRLHGDGLERIGDRLGATVVHVSQEMSLKRFRDMLSSSQGNVVVAYYVDQCGHSHSGPVKWMTERSEGIWVDLHEVDEDRIYRRISDRLAS